MKGLACKVNLYIYRYSFFFIMQVELIEMKSTNDSELKLVTFAAVVSKTQVAELLEAEKNSLIHLEIADGTDANN